MPRSYDPAKPARVLVNSFTATADLYEAQYENEQLLDAMNLMVVAKLAQARIRLRIGTRRL